MASASEDHTARVWGMPKGGIRADLVGHSAAVMDVRWSPDESRLATASLDGTVRLWNPETGQEVARFPCSGAMRSVDWSPDGTRLIAGGEDGIRLFDARPGYRADALDHFHRKAKETEWEEAAELAREILSRFTDEREDPWLQTSWWEQRSAPELAEPPVPEYRQTRISWGRERVDLERYLRECRDRTIWMTTRVFSPREQKVGLQVLCPCVEQVWRDGEVVLKAQNGEVMLNEGWNILQVRMASPF